MNQQKSTAPDLVWEDPPADGITAKTLRWQAIADALRARPGEWAIVQDGGNSANGTNISKGKIAAFRPAGAFEAVTRGSSGGNGPRIYARFVGGGSDD